MADALRACAKAAPAFRAALRLHLVEVNPVLRESQQSLLPKDAMWHERFDTIPAGPILLIANEFFDALPIRQFIRAGDGWRERCVALDGEGLRFAALPAAATVPHLPSWQTAAPDAIVEDAPERSALA